MATWAFISYCYEIDKTRTMIGYGVSRQLEAVQHLIFRNRLAIVFLEAVPALRIVERLDGGEEKTLGK